MTDLSPAQLEAAREYKPHGAARELFRCKAPEILIEGPAGTGKTTAVLTKVHALAETYPNSRHLIVRATRTSMTESVLEVFESRVLPAFHAAKAGPKRATRSVYHYPNGSVIVVGGLDNDDRIMSAQYDTVALFEATEATEENWEKLTTRLRNGKMPYQQAIADCNPAGPNHWLNRRAASGAMVRLLSRHDDNPSLTPEYLDKLDKLTGVRRLRLKEGRWAMAEGTVYPEFDAAVNVIDKMPDGWQNWRKIRSIDFGFTNPFVCQWWAIDGDGRMYCYREIYRTRRMVQDHAKVIVELTGAENIEATTTDHDAEDRATLDAHGVPSCPANKAVLPGIEAVRARLIPAGDGKPRLFFLRDALVEVDPALDERKLPKCTVDEMDCYVYPRLREGRDAKEEPVKENDHGMDCARYAVMHLDCSGGTVFYTDEPPAPSKPVPGVIQRSPKWDDWLKGEDDA